MDGIDWAASGMIAARTRLDIASENLANVSTGAFAATQARGELTAFGAVVRRVRSPRHGALTHTGRAFDLAIVGDGAFRVRRASGRIEETRDGRFVRERDGTLRDPRGRTLLGDGGAALHAADGDDHFTERIPLPRGSTVRAEFLEASSVDPIAEMIDVLAAERSFESAQKVISAIDGTREKSATDVARVK